MADDRLDPSSVARHSFEVARRGFDQNAVRAFLHEVSQALSALQRAEQQQRERADRAEARLALAEQPDETYLMEVLGEETTRVLTSAREASADIRAKAEQSAARLISEAQADASRIRSEAAAAAERHRAEVAAEAERILGQARGELDRRSAEAEDAAARIIEDAEALAASLRDEAAADREQARAEAATEVDAGRQRGREMVAEAQAVRERILKDLVARRRRARQQVEKLDAGRQRLLEAYDVVRRTLDEATHELTVSVAEARVAAEAAARRVEDEPESTLAELEAEIEAARLAGSPLVAPLAPAVEPDAHLDDDTSPGPFSGEVPAVESGPPATGAEIEAEHAPAEAVAPKFGSRRKRRRPVEVDLSQLPEAELIPLEQPDEAEKVRVIEQPAADAAEPEPAVSPEPAPEPDVGDIDAPGPAADPEPESVSPEAGPEPDLGDSDVDAGDRGRDAADVFARLRAEQGADAAPDAEAATDADGEALEPEVAQAAEPAEVAEPSGPFADRDAALQPIERELVRRLKRALADEQNDVLDRLRRTKPGGVDDLLGSATEHARHWSGAVETTLVEAAQAGAASLDGHASSAGAAPADLGAAIVAPLRERVERVFAAADGDPEVVSERLRALYREWKGQRLADAAVHFGRAAYAAGRFEAVPKGAKVRWLVGGPEPCPDCDDNGLSGALRKGESFATGHASPPAHEGCRCLLALED